MTIYAHGSVRAASATSSSPTGRTPPRARHVLRSGRLEAGKDGGLRLVLEDGEIHREDPRPGTTSWPASPAPPPTSGWAPRSMPGTSSRTTLRARPGGDSSGGPGRETTGTGGTGDVPVAAHRGASRHPGARVAVGAHRVPPAGRSRLRVRGVDPLHRRLLRPAAPGRGARARRDPAPWLAANLANLAAVAVAVALLTVLARRGTGAVR